MSTTKSQAVIIRVVVDDGKNATARMPVASASFICLQQPSLARHSIEHWLACVRAVARGEANSNKRPHLSPRRRRAAAWRGLAAADGKHERLFGVLAASA